MWDFSVIKDLLMNPVYTGAIASQKKDYRFKIGTIGEKKPEDWIVAVSYTHLDVYKRQTYNFLVALAFSQMFNLLCERADNTYGGQPKSCRWCPCR